VGLGKDIWLNDTALAYIDEPTIGAVEDALALILSSNQPDNGTLVTCYKMLSNLANNPDEAKYSSIRIQNAAFQSKVGSVPGGIDLFLAAGFMIAEDSSTSGAGAGAGAEESFLRHACFSNGNASAGNDSAASSNSLPEVAKKSKSIMKLKYVLRRVQEVLIGAGME
jgi:hypothetical protein